MAGDGLELLADPPGAVVLIDGFFDEHPAIRHKELLALMGEGVAVFGAASMGALRAAELHVHGMVGVGRIFEAYRDRRLVRDDEVAVLHGPAEVGWAALSEPLVNVRATLVQAVRQGVIGVAIARRALDAARSTFYPERSWLGLVAELSGGGAQAEIRALEHWLPAGRVDLKRLDAEACIQAALKAPAGRHMPSPPATLFTAELARRRGFPLA